MADPQTDSPARTAGPNSPSTVMDSISATAPGLAVPTTWNREDLLAVTELVATGTLRPVIDRTYPLAETAVGLQHVESRTRTRQGRHHGHLRRRSGPTDLPWWRLSPILSTSARSRHCVAETAQRPDPAATNHPG